MPFWSIHHSRSLSSTWFYFVHFRGSIIVAIIMIIIPLVGLRFYSCVVFLWGFLFVFVVDLWWVWFGIWWICCLRLGFWLCEWMKQFVLFKVYVWRVLWIAEVVSFFCLVNWVPWITWNCQCSKQVLDCLCSCMCCCWSWLCYYAFWFFSMFWLDVCVCVCVGFHGKAHTTRSYWKLSLVCVLYGEVILNMLASGLVYHLTFSWLQLCISRVVS